MKKVLLSSILLSIILFTSSVFANETLDIQKYANDMQPGWNLGNTYDSVVSDEVKDETAWGNPQVTEEFIEQIKDYGYKSIRIPITFDGRMNEDHLIDEDYLSRITNTVDWSLDHDLKVMINIHHDSWIWIKNGMKEDKATTVARFEAIWQQLATHFKDYPVDLMFESLNEPQFTADSEEEAQSFLDELNHQFYSIVRNSKGYNNIRPLVIPTMHTSSDDKYIQPLVSWLKEINDPYIIATVHYYSEWPFSVNIAGATKFSDNQKNHIHSELGRVYDSFTKNEVPVIIGEFGLLGFDTHVDTVQQAEKLKFFEYAIDYMQEHNLVHMLWDNGQHINRHNYRWYDKDFLRFVTTSFTGRSATAEHDFIYFKKDKVISNTPLQLNLNTRTLTNVLYQDKSLLQGRDYILDDETLTLTVDFLNQQIDTKTIGKYGTLVLEFNAGTYWKVDLRVYDLPAIGQNSDHYQTFSLPVQFNGDQLATLETIYDDGSGAGPQNWTTYKEFGYVFSPDYKNNKLTFNYNEWDKHSPLFNEVDDDRPITVRLHFWSGEVVETTIIKNGDIISTL